MGLSYDQPQQPQVVPYMDLGGGLNTRLDPHALQRNELAVSVNLWSSYDFVAAKRPGSVTMVTSGGTVNNDAGFAPGTCKSLLTLRVNNKTYLVYVGNLGQAFIAQAQRTTTGATWRHIGSFNSNAAFVTCAQMFNPRTQDQDVFFCDGLSIPQRLSDPLTGSLVNVQTGSGYLPTKYNTGSSGAGITPQYVSTLGNNSHLFYSGEPTNPSAVYISDPFYPESFTNYAMQVTTDPSAGSYYPAIIGNNDGVEGGPITGMQTLGSAMIIFKASATYAMIQTTLLGEVPAWQVVTVSPTTGAIAPLSITNFVTFICFLSIDGVYTTDGNTVQQISGDVPTIFDSSLSGYAARITNPSIARGVRHGNRYELFYSTANAAYCNEGVWFDFAKQTRFGHPVCGVITGMTPGGLAALRGPNDTGNVAWGDALINRVGEFGVGYADFDQPIGASLAGKADLFEDIFGAEACVGEKQMQDAYALIELLNVTEEKPTVNFFGAVIINLEATLAQVIGYPVVPVPPGGVWGEDKWGVMKWGSSSGSNFAVVKIPMQNSARGNLLQIAIKESSTTPWLIIGYCVYVNFQKTGY